MQPQQHWLNAIEQFFLVFVAIDNGLHFLLFGIGFFALQDRRDRGSRSEVESLVKSPLVPGISVIAPAFNEELTICDSVTSMLRLRHPNLEVIVVNDGSTDRTLQVLVESFKLYKSSRLPLGDLASSGVRSVYRSSESDRLVVINKINGGKADSLNAGLNYSNMPLVCAVDADSLIEKDALIGVVRPFLEDPEHIVAVGGIVRVLDGCEVEDGGIGRISCPCTLLGRFQVVEYLRAFLGGRVALSSLNSVLIISGAFGLFKKEAVIEVGGFSTDTVGEDMELVMRLHKRLRSDGSRNRIVFIPEPVCWTQVPPRMAVLQKQRNRWQRGALESVFRHAGIIGRVRYGALGLFSLPYFVVFELLGPPIELFGYAFTLAGLLFRFIEPAIAFQFFTASILFNLFLSLGAIAFEELTTRRYPALKDLFLLLLAALLEGLYYRQLTAWWRTKGILDYILKKRGWGHMERQSF